MYNLPAEPDVSVKRPAAGLQPSWPTARPRYSPPAPLSFLSSSFVRHGGNDGCNLSLFLRSLSFRLLRERFLQRSAATIANAERLFPSTVFGLEIVGILGGNVNVLGKDHDKILQGNVVLRAFKHFKLSTILIRFIGEVW